MSLLAKLLTTKRTLEWFLSRVDTLVSLKSILMSKCFATNVTTKRFLSRVNYRVSLQNLLLCKSFATNKRSLSCVDSHVPYEMHIATKCFTTAVTTKWFLHSV